MPDQRLHRPTGDGTVTWTLERRAGVGVTFDLSRVRDASVNDDLIVIVHGTPRWIRGDGESLCSSPATASEIATSWRTAGSASLKTLTDGFSLVVVEPRAERLHLYVDPFGLGSMFVAARPSHVVVSPEASAVAAVLERAQLDVQALPDIFNMRFLSGRRSLWVGVRQVLPGVLLTIDAAGQPKELEIRRVRFGQHQINVELPDASARTRSMLEAAYANRRDEGMDRVALLLSGGIDSSILAALAARHFPRATAYTAHVEGFENPELGRAIEIARRTGIRHRVVEVTDVDVARLYQPVMERLQEPSRHFNNIVLARLLEAAREDSDWVVTGDSADLLFGGGDLNSVLQYARKRGAFDRLPAWLQRAVARGLRSLPGRRAASLARVADASLAQLLQAMDVIPRTREASAIVRHIVADNWPSAELARTHFEAGPSHLETFQMWDHRTMLTAIYRRNTRLAERFDLRLWYPLKEPAIVDFALRLPGSLKFDVARGLSKPILRNLCDDLLGSDVSRWSKLGFPTPEREWMSGPLHAALDSARSDDAPMNKLLNMRAVRELDETSNHQFLWTLMTLETVLHAAVVSV